MHIKNHLHILLITLITSPLAHALDLNEALQRAEQNDAELASALAEFNAAEQTSPISRAGLLPNIYVEAFVRDQNTEIDYATGTDDDIDSKTTGYSLNLDQVIYSKKLWDTLDASDALVAQAAATYEAARQNMIIRVADSYFAVLGAQDDLAFARAEEQSVARQLEQSQERFNVGLIAITDVHESQARYDSAVAQRILAENTLDNRKEALRVIIGDPVDELKPLQNELPLQKPDPENIQQWQDKALEQNLTLKAARYGVEAAREVYKSNFADHYPTLSLNAKRESSDADDGTFGSGQRDTDDTRLTLTLNVPIYSGGLTTAQSRQSAADAERAQARLDQQRRFTVQDIRTSYLGVQTAISTVNAFKQALISARTALEATQGGFEAGTRTNVDVLVVEGSLYDSERNYSRSRYDYLLSTLELKRASGSLNAIDINQINQWLEQ